MNHDSRDGEGVLPKSESNYLEQNLTKRCPRDWNILLVRNSRPTRGRWSSADVRQLGRIARERHRQSEREIKMHMLMSVWALPAMNVGLIEASNSVLVKGFSLLDMFDRMGLPARLVAVVLAIMSIYSIGVMFERWLTFNAARSQSSHFVAQVAAALRSDQIEDAIAVSEQHRKSPLAIVVNAGLQEYLVQREEGGEIATIADATRDAIDRARAIKTAELNRGLSGLATIGSTAPFVGLLGTVIGIINAFQGLSVNQGPALESVSGGISEALVETAFGLLVAIPAVWMFNHFNSRLEAFRVEMNNSASELMVYLKRHNRNQARLTAS